MLVPENIQQLLLCCLATGLLASCNMSSSPESVCMNWLRERDYTLDQLPSGHAPENFDSSRLRGLFEYEEFGRPQAKQFDDASIVWFETKEGNSVGCIVFRDSQRPTAFVTLSSDVSEVEPVDFRIVGPN